LSENIKKKNIKKEETIEENVKKVVDFTKLAKLIYTDLEIQGYSSAILSSFTKERVSRMLENPRKNQKQLRNLSRLLYVISSHYRRLCQYYGQMSRLDWYIKPYKLRQENLNIDKYKISYYRHLDFLTDMNIKHELGKVLEIVFLEGIYYGYEYYENDSYFIQRLDPDYCEITGSGDGVYIFAFDMSYFDKSNVDINSYAKEFQILYKAYKDAKADKSIARRDISKYRYKTLSAEKSICIKTDESVAYPYPPFSGVISDIFDIEDYKALKKASKEMENYGVITGEIPILTGATQSDDFAVDLDTAIAFGADITNQLPDQVAFLPAVFNNMKFHKLSDSTSNIDGVHEAVNNFWEATGTTKDLFTGESSTDASAKRATATDEQIVFSMTSQLERWINRRLKFIENGNTATHKFLVNILDTTNFNIDDFVSRELKLAQFSIPNKIRLCVASGMNQSEVGDMAFLENEVLDLPNKFVPLVSSNTMSSSDTSNDNTDDKSDSNTKIVKEDKSLSTGVSNNE